MNNNKRMIVAIVVALIFLVVGMLFAVSCLQEYIRFTHEEVNTPLEFRVAWENHLLQNCIIFTMFLISGSTLSYSLIKNGFYFRKKIHYKISSLVCFLMVFIVSFLVTHFLLIILAFFSIVDCTCIFVIEIISKRKVKKSQKIEATN